MVVRCWYFILFFSLIGLCILYMLRALSVYVMLYKINRTFFIYRIHIYICIYPCIFLHGWRWCCSIKAENEFAALWEVKSVENGDECMFVCVCIFQPLPLTPVLFRTRICIPIHSTYVLAQLFIKNCERAAEKIKESGQKSLRANLYGSFIALVL